jgi:protein phosphatase 1L
VYCQFHPVQQNGEGQEQHVGCFGVFDGHGGPCAAAFVRDRLFASLLSHESFPRDLMKALADAYADTDEQYCELDGEQQRDDGCTAVTGVLVGSRLAVAHVGDSRCGALMAGRQPCGPHYMQAAGCTAGTARLRW